MVQEIYPFNKISNIVLPSLIKLKSTNNTELLFVVQYISYFCVSILLMCLNSNQRHELE